MKKQRKHYTPEEKVAILRRKSEVHSMIESTYEY